MDLKLINQDGKSSTHTASDALFGRDYNEALIHQVVTAYQANGRQGTRAQKSRGQINKSHKKPWRQKGTGRARAGQANSPLWRGGGRIFPNKPDENFEQKINRKMYRGALCAILSELNRQGRLMVVDSFDLAEPKTKALVAKLGEFGLAKRPLIVTESGSDALYLAARNIPYVQVRDVQGLDPATLVGADNVVITTEAVKKVEEWLA
jgi:large subunit ribosomal protein L4